MSKSTPVFLLIVLLFPVILFAQVENKKINQPIIQDFAPTLQFLASPLLEGRETGTRGAEVAAGFIASRMGSLGLKPYIESNNSTPQLSDYFQPFKLIRCKTDMASIEVFLPTKQEPQQKFNIYSDFKIQNVFQSTSLHSIPVFAGYGIVAPELGYNDYSGLDVKGKIVLVMEGYPGQNDSTSKAWKKFKSVAENDEFDLDKKCLDALKQGASAVITISKAYLANNSGKERKKNVAPVKNEAYTNAEYLLPNVANTLSVSCFRLNKNSSEKLASVLEFDFRKAERQIAKEMMFEPALINKKIHASASATVDTIIVNNVIGVLPGKDTSKTVIVGAHYDHLGKRENTIFYGSDDNASGVAGLLALAKVWTENQIVPPCNILFASWTAEEKGLIGSEYFTKKLANPEKVKLYINMDMISRSVKEDTNGRMLSIGTRTSDEYLREMARGKNSTLDKPFILDLWDVTGHSGSDYANFMAKNIPVMTYNTGLHDDYHTPRDIPESADLVKMADVLNVVNESLQDFIKNISAK